MKEIKKESTICWYIENKQKYLEEYSLHLLYS